MKRLIETVFTLLFLTICAGSVSACPLEGANMPNDKFWKTGIQVNHMFDADMKEPKGEISSGQYFFTGSFGITEWLCFDGKLGIGDITFDMENSQKIEYPANFAGGYGGRILLYDDKKNDMNYILGLHHISVHPDSTKINNVKHEAIMDEWQASLLVSKKVWHFRPYISGKFSQIYLIRKVDGVRKRIKPEDGWGLIVGIDMNINENARFSLEGRFFDEEALNVGFDYTF